MPSTPERRNDRPSLSRRSNRHNQQPTDEHRSPFRRAHQARLTDHFDASLNLSPPYESNSPRHRRNFSQTNSLRSAFAFASRLDTMPDREAAPDTLAGYDSYDSYSRSRDPFLLSSPVSNPPNELAETYRQIDDAGSLVDENPFDADFQLPNIRGSRSRGSSSASARKRSDWFATYDLHDVTNESPPRKQGDRVEDERRLRRATSSRSPVLSNAGTRDPLTSENLQRRDKEEELQEGAMEEDDNDHGPRPPLNLPSWGSRAAHRGKWLEKMTRRSTLPLGSTVDRSKDPSPPRVNPDRDVQNNVEEGTMAEDGPTGKYGRIPLSDAQNKLSLEQNAQKGTEIPNTPVTIFPKSYFAKKSPIDRDSRVLLQRLSRAESPGQPSTNTFKTPEAQKVSERPRIYDKTPVVTGAWIDTPMTERVDKFPEELSRDIVPSPPQNHRYASTFLPRESRISEVSEPSESEAMSKTEAEKGKQEQEKPSLIKTEPVAENKPKDDEAERSIGGPNKEGPKEEPKEARQQGKQPEANQKPASKNKRPLIKPNLPKSALETVLQDFKAHKDILDVGDDTIESLQGLLEGKPSENATPEEEDAAYEKAIMKKLELGSSGGNETVDLDRLNEKLKSLADNIQKVKSGLKSLEEQATRDADTLTVPSSKGSKHSRATICAKCQAETEGQVFTIFSFPRLWHRDPISRRVRPTGLGWCLLISLAWFWSETTMCDYYCHPFISNVCEGNCLRPDAPRFPYVIPTMLWRWLNLSSLFTPLWAVVIAVGKFIALSLGLWDGYVEEAPRPLNLSGELRIHGTRVVSLAESTAAASSGFFSPSRLWSGREERPAVPEAVPELKLNGGRNPSGRQASANSWDEDGSMEDDEVI
ncbi:uncharacterized protein BP01DRAFT_356481 [Aspergillus saccharolyticus JOP 1030-1]|uniref:Uncharacterized protein n=1 Tax=Aspergillus saccharolyticus JOP 1030-1 TaxID=1450539 RepID=A0A318ZD59_9EURO|nr:hypothetical protein BP01DRAFT_356481 [Aspergillus saccharolyticus JOP 1030-1]PYH45436.1 hypothetical protein BP01DRAFT_356481 [Aspergillus saccharolyticus JOP 1030-1]